MRRDALPQTTTGGDDGATAPPAGDVLSNERPAIPSVATAAVSTAKTARLRVRARVLLACSPRRFIISGWRSSTMPRWSQLIHHVTVPALKRDLQPGVLVNLLIMPLALSGLPSRIFEELFPVHGKVPSHPE